MTDELEARVFLCLNDSISIPDGGGVVDNDRLPVTDRLGSQTPQAFWEKLSLVVHCDDNRNTRARQVVFVRERHVSKIGGRRLARPTTE